MSEIKIIDVEVCPECGHGIDIHFQAVSGRVRCLHKSSGVTTSGIAGIPWSESCDCTDYNSNAKAEREARDKRTPRRQER